MLWALTTFARLLPALAVILMLTPLKALLPETRSPSAHVMSASFFRRCAHSLRRRDADERRARRRDWVAQHDVVRCVRPSIRHGDQVRHVYALLRRRRSDDAHCHVRSWRRLRIGDRDQTVAGPGAVSEFPPAGNDVRSAAASRSGEVCRPARAATVEAATASAISRETAIELILTECLKAAQPARPRDTTSACASVREFP